MAKDYKDHSSMGAPGARRLIARLVIAVLLVTIGVLGYSYWTLVTGHRESTARLALVKGDLDSALAARGDLVKMLDSCKEELKMSGDERKQLKDSEATLTERLRTLQVAQQTLKEEQTLLKEKLNKEIAICQETSKQEVSNCNASCGLKIEEAKKSAEDACQRQKLNQVTVSTVSPVIQEAIKIPKQTNEPIAGDSQQNHPPPEN